MQAIEKGDQMNAGQQTRMAQARAEAFRAFADALTRDEKLAAVRQYADAYRLVPAGVWADFQREAEAELWEARGRHDLAQILRRESK